MSDEVKETFFEVTLVGCDENGEPKFLEQFETSSLELAIDEAKGKVTLAEAVGDKLIPLRIERHEIVTVHTFPLDNADKELIRKWESS